MHVSVPALLMASRSGHSQGHSCCFKVSIRVFLVVLGQTKLFLLPTIHYTHRSATVDLVALFTIAGNTRNVVQPLQLT